MSIDANKWVLPGCSYSTSDSQNYTKHPKRQVFNCIGRLKEERRKYLRLPEILGSYMQLESPFAAAPDDLHERAKPVVALSALWRPLLAFTHVKIPQSKTDSRNHCPLIFNSFRSDIFKANTERRNKLTLKVAEYPFSTLEASMSKIELFS